MLRNLHTIVVLSHVFFVIAVVSVVVYQLLTMPKIKRLSAQDLAPVCRRRLAVQRFLTRPFMWMIILTGFVLALYHWVVIAESLWFWIAIGLVFVVSGIDDYMEGVYERACECGRIEEIQASLAHARALGLLGVVGFISWIFTSRV